MNKKLNIFNAIVVLLFYIFILSGCFVLSQNDKFINIRPNCYYNTKWTSTSPNINFIVDDEGFCSGEIMIENKKIKFVLGIPAGTDIIDFNITKDFDYKSISYYKNQTILSATCIFGEKEMVVRFNNYRCPTPFFDELFKESELEQVFGMESGYYHSPEITFARENLEKTTAATH